MRRQLRGRALPGMPAMFATCSNRWGVICSEHYASARVLRVTQGVMQDLPAEATMQR